MSQLVNYNGKQKFKNAYKNLIVILITHEATWAIQEQTENLLKIYWMVELVFVATNSGDFWIGVKGLSNVE